MSAGPRYAAGTAAVALGALAAGALFAPPARTAVWSAAALALVLQAPLGWWLVRALGTERLLVAWSVGIMSRVALLAAAAWILGPLAGLAAEPLLMGLAVVLVALVAVEAAVVVLSVRYDGVR